MMNDRLYKVGNSDKEIKDFTEDSLNIRPTAEGLAEFIKKCATPMTISVSGEWGSGKSSLMEMVENSLMEKKKNIRDQEEDMQVNQSLMQEIDALLEAADERYEYVQIARERLLYEINKYLDMEIERNDDIKAILKDLKEELNIDLKEKICNSLIIQKETFLALDQKMLLKTDSATRFDIVSKIEEYWDNKVLQSLKSPLTSMPMLSGIVHAIEQIPAKQSILKILKRYLNDKAERELDEIEKKIGGTYGFLIPASLPKASKKLEVCISALISKYFEELSKLFGVLFTIKCKLRQSLNEYVIKKVYYEEKTVSAVNSLVKEKIEREQDLNDREKIRKQLECIALQYVNGEIANLQEMLDQMNGKLPEPVINEEDVNKSIRRLDAITENVLKADWNIGEWFQYGSDGDIECLREDDHWSYRLYDEYDEYVNTNFIYFDSNKSEEQCKKALKKLKDLFLALITSTWNEDNGEWFYWKPENEEDKKEYTGYHTSEPVAQCKEKMRMELEAIDEYPKYCQEWIDFLVSEICKGKYTRKTIDGEKKNNESELKEKIKDIYRRIQIDIEQEKLNKLHDNNKVENGQFLFALLAFDYRYKFYQNILTYPTNKYDIIPVRFDTWQYASFSLGNNLAISLFDRIFDALGEKRNSYFKWAGSFIKRFAPFMMGTVFGINDPVDSFFNSIKNDNYKDYAAEVVKLKNTLHDLIMKKTTTGKTKKLVIFIDNLDRLQPVKAVELLEILKIFFGCPNCVFILAVDESIIIQGVKEKYGQNIADDKAKEFFDKIVQLPLQLPVANYDLEMFISKNIEDIFASIKTKVAVLEPCTSDDLRWFEEVTEDYACRNPRRIKRFLNMYQFLLLVTVNEIEDNVSGAYMENEKALSMDALKALYLATGIQFFNRPLYDNLVTVKEPDIAALFINTAVNKEGTRALNKFLKEKNYYNLMRFEYFQASLESTKLNIQGGLSEFYYRDWEEISMACEYLNDTLDETFNCSGYQEGFLGRAYSDDFDCDIPVYENFKGYDRISNAYKNPTGEGELFWRVSFEFRGYKGSKYLMDISVLCLSCSLLDVNEDRLLNGLRKVMYKKDKDLLGKDKKSVTKSKVQLYDSDIWPYSSYEYKRSDNEEKKAMLESCKLKIFKEDDDGLGITVSYKDQKYDTEVCYKFNGVKLFDSQRDNAKDISDYNAAIYNKVKDLFENF